MRRVKTIDNVPQRLNMEINNTPHASHENGAPWGVTFFWVAYMRYDKPPLTLTEQVAQLERRGMQFTDERSAEQVLARLNYYRLTAYWYPFYSDTDASAFAPGTHFDDVIQHYEFDRRLRLCVLDAIERFEIALRTQFAYHLAHRHGPWAHEDESLFSKRGRHRGLIVSLDRELHRSQEPFIVHYKRKYSAPARPPIWIACEVMSLGVLSALFDTLRTRADRKAIAQDFGLDELVLRSFAHHINIVRNICAHHGRLWNRSIPVRTKLPNSADAALISSLEPAQPQKLYNTIVLLGCCLKQISDDVRWRTQLVALIDEHPAVDTVAMGFPEDWRARPFWQ